MNHRKIVDQHRRTVDELEAEQHEQESEKQEVNKYQVLHKKDMEMTAFMESFEETKNKEVGQLQELEETIPALLEHMSSQVSRQTAMPSKAQVKDNKDNLAYQEGLSRTQRTLWQE